jgi:hypothetical protein
MRLENQSTVENFLLTDLTGGMANFSSGTNQGLAHGPVRK